MDGAMGQLSQDPFGAHGSEEELPALPSVGPFVKFSAESTPVGGQTVPAPTCSVTHHGVCCPRWTGR